MKTLSFALVLATVASTARADPPFYEVEATPDACAASYDQRLADIRNAIEERASWRAQRARAAPMLEWFHEHCRFLSELEIVVRKIDDLNAFVCDTKKGRPRGLTGDMVMDFSEERYTTSFAEWSQSNRVCEAHDVAAGRQTLVTLEFVAKPTDADKLAELKREVEIMCWRVQSDRCDKLRASFGMNGATVTQTQPSVQRTPDF